MSTPRPRLAYVALTALWLVVVSWQAWNHFRIRESLRVALIKDSRVITTSLGVIIRSQRFRGFLDQERIERALKELVESGELSSLALRSVALLNASGDVVASSGPPIDKSVMQAGEHWEPNRVTLVNLVNLVSSDAPEGETNRPTIVLQPWRRGTNAPGATNASTGGTNDFRGSPRDFRPPSEFGRNRAGDTNSTTDGTNDVSNADRRRPPPPGGQRFRRPPWMSEKVYEDLLASRGLHGLAISMSTENFQRACVRDIWMRCIIVAFAGVAFSGIGLAWRNQAKSSELQLRLLRASELNTHLKQMNLAAAGLAHETRNPLNIIRGLAQMISRAEEAPAEIRKKSREMIDETDRITAQLNEFINYSRPREVRRAPVALNSVIAEVVRALNYDIDEKSIQLQTLGDALTIEADEQLLRQVLFNLLLNAIQAVPPHAEIQITAGKTGPREAFLEVRDSGPGVPADQRTEIFKPYVTNHNKGTGLGLAVVNQIVLAHQWDVECLANEPTGAVFRITHLKLAS